MEPPAVADPGRAIGRPEPGPQWLDGRRGAVAVVVAAIAVGANTLAGQFVWDDLVQIVANPWIKDLSRLGEAFTTHVVGFDPGLRTSFYRPLVHVAHAVVHAVFGLAPWGFHGLNVLLHAAVSLCVYLLLARFTARVPALLGALLFAVHPVHSEAVAWASGIFDLAMALGVLLTLLAITDERPAVRRCAPALFALALLWKEPAIAVLPIAAVLLVHARRPARWGELSLLGLVAVGYVVLRVNALGGLTGGDHNPIVLTASESVLTGVAIVAEYAKLLVLPVGLTPLHDIRVVATPLDLRFVAGCAAIVCVGAGAWLGRRSPAVLLGLGLLVLPLVPALYVPALKNTLLAERYLYLPSAGAALLLASALSRWPRGSVVALAVVPILAVGAVVRNRAWHDAVALWSDAVEKAPSSAVAWESLGGAYAVQRRYAEAIPPLAMAVQLDDRRADAQTNLAISLGALGRREEAVGHALAALRDCPSCPKAQEVLAWLTR